MTDIPDRRRRDLLYDPRFEHDACGVGFVADISGRQSHRIIKLALDAIHNLAHRSAMDADAETGDGAGVLTQIPHKLFQKELEKLGIPGRGPGQTAVGVFFLPLYDNAAREHGRSLIEDSLRRRSLRILRWRPVPVDSSVLGSRSAQHRPDIQHLLVARTEGMLEGDFERALYLVRKEVEQRMEACGIRDFYICSLSSRTIVYKGLLLPDQLRAFYFDLQDPNFETALAVFHERYSTNTFPNWILAHPFRMLAHNGEINTIQGNRNSLRAREPELRSDVWGDEIALLKPIAQPNGSDSMTLDNTLEFLTQSGRGILHAMMMLLPEAHEKIDEISGELRGFYDYHACLMEPWDGPAAVTFSDGRMVGAALDRNGLRPARYQITDDGLIILASEAGVIDIDPRRVVRKGRLGPGQMIAVDTARSLLLDNDAIKGRIAAQKPFYEWVSAQMTDVPTESGDVAIAVSRSERDNLTLQQRAFGYTLEDVQRILEPMGVQAKEPVGSMGDDAPLSVLSEKPRLLYTYFRQLFAQVTNPPIDSLREKLVMSLTVLLGPRGRLLEEDASSARVIRLSSPILTDAQLRLLREGGTLPSAVLNGHFDVAEEDGLASALRSLCDAAVAAIDDGKSILILSDRGVDASRAPIPMLMAVGAVHHHLIRQGRRMRASLVVESAEPREDHHFACLLGYGASAVNPYLAFATIADLALKGSLNGLTPVEAVINYKKAVEEAILKIMAKMGISTLSSYQGAQIFEALGLGADLIEMCFSGTSSRIGGIGMKEVAEEALRAHAKAFHTPHRVSDAGMALEDAGYFRFRSDGEYHAFNPQVFKALHRAVRSGDYQQQYRLYSELVEHRPPVSLRDLMTCRAGNPIPLEQVEPVETIVRRFSTSAMSHGALSREAHEALAIATNRIGARSNSGEGGEAPDRYRRRANGDWPNSQIKQVASARFGVTTEYLVSATELQIKMAQGSKPGEGGQLPGHKVTEEIAAIRHSVPGVTLISPPPHHDIYSIEDLAQLIYDLRQVNPRAQISVKLVSEAGVGTVAAGVAKAHADLILISGHDGGTGASPLGSIKNAGIPWELGLAEAQQVLIINGLRSRVRLQVDGGLKTGRDVVIAAMLGAEEFGFGSAAVVALGCVMARQCHLNTCPVGIATQREDLRTKFPGQPEHVIHFLTFVAQDVREILARMGFRRLDEVVGRTDLLECKQPKSVSKAAMVDLSRVLAPPLAHDGHAKKTHVIGSSQFNDRIVEEAMEAIEQKRMVILSYPIRNTDRAIAGRLAGELALRYGDAGLPDGSIECRFEGSAGQSFGAFCVPGMRLVLTGEANDYVGKSMTGGEIIVRPSSYSLFAAHENVILGNTALYGATGGTLYAAGRAGERFCVRNSGGCAVVEGVGDHGCEYMTGGLVIVLGETGRNFAAGMTGGLAYVLDPDRKLPTRYNPELVDLEQVSTEDVDLLRSMIVRHYERTGSRLANDILRQWDEYLALIWKVVPKSVEGRQAVKRQPFVNAPSRVRVNGLAKAQGDGRAASSS